MFKLRCELKAHSSDVRCLAELRFGGKQAIISGSRDNTVAISYEAETGKYSKEDVLGFHQGFVSSVVVVSPCQAYPNGLLISGSYDKTVRIYSFDNLAECKFVLTHDDIVSSVQFDQRRALVVTGGLNGFLRVWRENECLTTVKAHEGPVWAVAVVSEALAEGNSSDFPCMLTASADKTIRLWEEGLLGRTFMGHTDCVRGLELLNDDSFLSCSNDHSIRQWNLKTGECLVEYSGHAHFVYSVSASPDGLLIASGGEDHTIRVWNTGESTPEQKIEMPCQTVWCVLFLNNGDIVCGCSDSTVRIFTRSSERTASSETIEQFDQQVVQFKQKSGPHGAIDWDQLRLPGPEALNRQGAKDGELMLIRAKEKAELYQWSEVTQQWAKTGEAVESLDVKSASQKTVDNKAYDYVFDVDVEDGKEPLKLPFNKTDDPWVAAQQFISRNDLPQVYMEQVAQFIIKNVPDLARQKPSVGCLDPFTGESCYTTGSVERQDTSVNVGPAGDPFTGSRYMPSSDDVEGDFLPTPLRPRGEHMPLKAYILFRNANKKALFAKLEEFNTSASIGSFKISDEQMGHIKDFSLRGAPPTPCIVDILQRLTNWPIECLVPVIDLMRLVFLEDVAITALSSAEQGHEIADFLHNLLEDPSVSVYGPLQIVVFRCFANIFYSEYGRSLMRPAGPPFYSFILSHLRTNRPAIQTAVAATFANLCLLLHLSSDCEARKIALIHALVSSWSPETESQISLNEQAIFYLLQGIVTVLWGDKSAVDYANSLHINRLITKWKDTTSEEKSKEIARSVERMMFV